MPKRDTWKLVTDYDVTLYKCGLQSGDRVALRKALVTKDLAGNVTGMTYPAGEIWTVLSGSKADPDVVWFRQSDGNRHTWDDEATSIEEWFEDAGERTGTRVVSSSIVEIDSRRRS